MKQLSLVEDGKIMRFFSFVMFFIFMSLFFSCSIIDQKSNQYTYWINSYTVNCEGVSSMKCMQVYKGEVYPEENNWENFYSDIIGFNYREGFVYKLILEEKKLYSEQIPADASSLEYTLIQIISTSKMSEEINGDWLLIALSTVSVKSIHKEVVLSIDSDKKSISGSDSCNRIMGRIEKIYKNEIKFGFLGSTRMMCRDMSLADAFHSGLSNTRSFKMEKGILYFYDLSGKEILSFKKKK